MTADRLIRLYPRGWRERYGEEFVATIGDDALRLQQIIDILAGAIDAWLTPEVRRATRASARDSATQGDRMESTMKAICAGKSLRYTKRDAMIGAGVMLGSTLLFSVAGILLKRRGFEVAGDIVVSNGFMVSLTLSMPFWILKGQSWRAQVVLVGGVTLFLIAISWLAFLI